MAPPPQSTTLLVRSGHAPLHRHADSLSEQVTEALLGHALVTLEEKGDWLRVRAPDGYEGWVQSRHATQESPTWRAPWGLIAEPWANLRRSPHYQLAPVLAAPMGVRLPQILGAPEGWVGLLMPSGETLYTEARRVDLSGRPWPANARRICRTARRLLGAPYLWGGCTAFGIDCSGYVQLVFGLHGVSLPRDAGPQGCSGIPIHQPECGDLVFFGPPVADTDPERITHVGLSLDRDRFIHASGSRCVRIDSLSTDPYRRRFRFARRVLSHER